MTNPKEQNLNIQGFECSKCGEWIVLEKTDEEGIFRSDHYCGRRLYGVLKNIKEKK